MAKEQIYPYAVARIRMLERSLLTEKNYIQMADAKNAEDALKILAEAGYSAEEPLTVKNYEEAFRNAHTLKGVCQNLSFDRLYEVSHELIELLRDGTGEQPGISEAMEKVTEVYEMTIEGIKKGL